MADPEKASEGDDVLDPIGPELWIGQVLVILGIIGGIYLAGKVGFREMTRFTAREDYYQARRMLAFVRTEFEQNLSELRATRDSLQAGKRAFLGANVTVPIRTQYLEAASTQEYMFVVNAELLRDIARLFSGYPLILIREGYLPKGKGMLEESALKICQEAVEQAEPLLRRFQAEEKALEDAIQRMEKGQ